MNEEINEFIGRTSEQIKSLFNRVEKLENTSESLKQITTILELQQKQYEDHHKVVEQINENLINLNSTVKEQGKQIGELGLRVGSLEDDGKIDTRKIKKDVIYNILPSSIFGLGFGLLVAYLVWYFGWK